MSIVTFSLEGPSLCAPLCFVCKCDLKFLLTVLIALTVPCTNHTLNDYLVAFLTFASSVVSSATLSTCRLNLASLYPCTYPTPVPRYLFSIQTRKLETSASTWFLFLLHLPYLMGHRSLPILPLTFTFLEHICSRKMGFLASVSRSCGIFNPLHMYYIH